MHFTEKQIEHHKRRHSHLDYPPKLELLHVGKQIDSEYAVFLCKEPWTENCILFSYPSQLEPFGLSYWEKKTSQTGWTADIRAFARKKINQFSMKYSEELARCHKPTQQPT